MHVHVQVRVHAKLARVAVRVNARAFGLENDVECSAAQLRCRAPRVLPRSPAASPGIATTGQATAPVRLERHVTSTPAPAVTSLPSRRAAGDDHIRPPQDGRLLPGCCFFTSRLRRCVVTHAFPTDPRLGAGVSEETPGDTSRFLDYVRSFEGESNGPVIGGSYPRLPSITWHDPTQFPITAALENRYDEIREEVLRLPPTSFYRENECIGRIGEWEVFWLFELGEKNEFNCSKLPVTTAVIESHGAIQTIAGLIYISKMRPGTHISPHRGPTNIRVRCHLGIQVPEGDCAISIGGEKKLWREGRCLLLDDHQEHEAWNHTQFDRIVLIVDVWHPGLSSQEISLLKGLHKYAYVQSSALAARGQRNASSRADPPSVRSGAAKSFGCGA